MATGLIKAGGAFLEITARDGTAKAIRSAQQRLNRFRQSVKSAGASLLRLGVGAGIGLGFVTKIFAGFDDTMRAVQGVTQATGQDFESLTEKAKELGRTTSFTAKQVAESMLALGRAGFSTREIEESIAGVLNLARATGTELGEASQQAADILRGFGLDVSQMTRVVDVATATTNKSSQTMIDYFEAIKLVAPSARAAGHSLEETSAAIGVLANAGIKGSLAGTALRKAYLQLADSTVRSNLEKMTGVLAVDGAGNLRSITSILREIGQATADLPTAERLSTFNEIFGLRAGSSALIIADNAKSVGKLNDSLLEAGGTSSRVAAEMDAGIGGAVRRLLSALEGIAIAVGDALAGPLGSLAGLLTENARSITQWIQRNQLLVVGIAAAVPLVLTVGAGMVALGIAAGGASTALGALGAAIAFLLSPMGLVLTGATALTVAFVNLTDEGRIAAHNVASAFGAMGSFVRGVFEGIQNAIKANDLSLAGQIATQGLKVAFLEAKSFLIRIWQELTTTLINAWDIMTTNITVAFFQAIEKIGQAYNKMTDLVREGVALVSEDAAGLVQTVTVNREFLAQGEIERDASDRRIQDRNQALIDARRDRTGELEAERDELRALLDQARIEAERAAASRDSGFALPPLAAADTSDVDEVDLGSIRREIEGATIGSFSARAAQLLNRRGESEQRKTNDKLDEANRINREILDAIRGISTIGFG